MGKQSGDSGVGPDLPEVYKLLNRDSALQFTLTFEIGYY